MSNISFEKSYITCGDKVQAQLVLEPLYEKSKLSISLDQPSKIFYSLLLLYV